MLGFAAGEAAAHGGSHPTPFPTGTPTPSSRPSPSGGTRPPGSAFTNSRNSTRWEEWWSINRWNHLRIRRRSVQYTGKKGADAKFADTAAGQFLIEALKSSHYDTRSAACIALGKAGGEPEVVQVRARAFDKHHEVRESALLGLALLRADLRKADVLELLVNRKEKSRLRAMAALALGLSRDPASATPLLDRLRAPNEEEEVRGAAALALGVLGETGVIVELQRAALNTSNADVIRANAVTALAHLAKIRATNPAVAVPGAKKRKFEPDSLEALTILMRRWLRGDNRKAVRRAAVLAFGTLGDESHLGEITRAMKVDPDDMVQRLAMITAAKLANGTPQAPYIQRQLSLICTGSGRMEGKGFAAIALGLLGEREGGRALMHVFKSGRHQSLRGAGAIGLGLLRHEPAVALLLAEATGRGNPTLRAQATIALGMIGSPKVYAPLRTMLAETDRPQIKAAAAAGLALSGLPQDVKGVVALLKEKNAYVRMSAVQALGVLRDDLALEPLMAHFKSESGPEIKALTVVAVGNILARRPVSAFQELAQHVNYLLRMPSLQQAIRLQ